MTLDDMTPDEVAEVLRTPDRWAVAELRELREQLVRGAIAINQQLDEAEGIAKSEGRYADPGWWAAAKAAKRIKRNQVQALEGIIKRREKKEFAETFMEMTRRELPRATYEMLVTMTKEFRDA